MDRVIVRKNYYKIVVPIILVFIFILSLVLKKIFGNYTPTYTIKNSQIIYSFLTERELSKSVQTVGTIQPLNRVIIESPEEGIISEVTYESGQYISKGDIVLILSNEELEIELNRLREFVDLKDQELKISKEEQNCSEVENLELLLDIRYRIEKLANENNRDNQLFKRGAITKEQLLNSNKDLEYWNNKLSLLLDRIEKKRVLLSSRENILNIELSALIEKIEVIHSRMNRLIVRSPSIGILNLEELYVGQNIEKQQRLGVIDLQDRFKIVAYIDDFYISSIRLGDTATFSIKGNTDRLYTAQLSYISSVVSGSRIKLEFLLTSILPKDIRPGQTLTIKILQSQPEPKYVIKSGAFLKESGGRWIYKVEDDIAIKTPITTGIKTSDYIEVLSGLDLGDKVVISSSKSYKDYRKLKIEGIE